MATVPKSTATRQFAGLVLAAVEPDRLESLRELLREVGQQTIDTMHGRAPSDPIVPFRRLGSVHYARFVLLEHDRETGPLLAFSTDYDGPEGEDACSESRALRFHLDELEREAGPGLERIFACCRGFRAGNLASYLKRHRLSASTFYVGSSGRSRNQIEWEAELRREVDAILDAGRFVQTAPETVRQAVIRELATRRPELCDANGELDLPYFPPQPLLERKISALKSKAFALALGLAALAVFAIWNWFPFPDWMLEASLFGHAARGAGSALIALLALTASVLLLLARFRQLERSDPQFQPEFTASSHDQFRVASTDENRFLQNQLTHLVRIKPGPLRWCLIRAVFYALSVLARNRYNKGKLGGIPSIHFARWVLIPNRGVLFFSNFDSSWPSYLGDFIDQASSGLTAVWSNTIGYPRTTWLVRAGSRDASRFLAWTRHHQLPTEVWYAAYPGLSIVNVNANTEIHRGLTRAGRDEIDAATWLFRLRGVDRLFTDQLFSEQHTREPPLDVSNIQGIILKGYGHMPEARYLLLRVRQPQQELRAWLAGLPLTSAAAGSRTMNPPEPLLNVAFTHAGLLAIGLDAALCARFSTPFVQGSDDEYRARVNGDVGDSAPGQWAWGSNRSPVHVLLLVYAKTRASVTAYAERYVAEAARVGLELVQSLEGTTLADRKEHFGFRDGIAQPVVEGSGRAEVEGNTIAAGEILLGHKDGYGNVSPSPLSSCGFAFGHDGSYLVFRQLAQDVPAFWRYCAEQQGSERAIQVASKLVGRWPSGAPLVRHPDKDPNDARFIDEDDFSYLASDGDNDRYGARCPFGAHVRRTNPRDWQLGESPEESRRLSNLHRIVRRGRPYGRPLLESMSPVGLIEAAKSTNGSAREAERGLQFLCFNASIERQFEFIQQQWCNNPKFAGLNSDADPLLGLRRPAPELGTDPASFAVQSDVKRGLAARCTALPQFVRVVGSAYFFMPSLAAVKLLHQGIRPAPRIELESPPPDEQLHIDSLIDSLREKLKRDYATGRMLRDAHPKMHGCVKARFEVPADLEESLRVGLFQTARSYDAWVRFSNQEGTVSADEKRDIRGAAIKLMGVPGKKLLDGEEDSPTHDFILISHDAFVTKDVAEFDALIKAVVKKRVPRFLLGHWKVAWNLWQALKRHANPLEIRYFGVVPYLFGSSAVKYTLRPVGRMPGKLPANPSPNYLREALKADLARGPAVFDFMIQRQAEPARMPIEDPSVAWRERDAPFVKVASLVIPQQDFDTPAQQVFGENLSFNPWRCLPEHRPLGGISRARRQVYRALSHFRHDRNAEPREEPLDWTIPTDSFRIRNAQAGQAAPPGS
jgi:Dyp-type peroxidase family